MQVSQVSREKQIKVINVRIVRNPLRFRLKETKKKGTWYLLCACEKLVCTVSEALSLLHGSFKVKGDRPLNIF